MGSGDLNLKKEWHPLTYKNQEAVWLAEKRQAEEERKMEQLKKELEQERALQELIDLNHATGRVKNKSERIEWMYSGPGSSGTGDLASQEEKEAFLLGKKRVDSLIEQGQTVEELRPHRAFTLTESAMYGFKANSWKDTQAKIREDPLLAIKKREQSSLQNLIANPLKIKQIEKIQGKDERGKEERGKEESHKDERRQFTNSSKKRRVESPFEKREKKVY